MYTRVFFFETRQNVKFTPCIKLKEQNKMDEETAVAAPTVAEGRFCKICNGI
jgi:hypothetical protein